MDLAHALLLVGSGVRPESFEIFERWLDTAWVHTALQATGTATIRRRKLPALQAVWLVIGMALFRDRSIAEVVRHLGLVLPPADDPTARPPEITSSAVAQARDRLGAAPLEKLFKITARAWALPAANADRWRGLAIYGMDGTGLRVADSPANDAHFGRPGSRRGRAGYPQLRLVALMALRSHLLAALGLGPWKVGELTLAEKLVPEIPENSLTILDRGFVSHGLFHRIANGATNRHWVVRGKSNLKFRTVRELGPNDTLVEVAVNSGVRRADPEVPTAMQMRVVRYQRKGFQPRTLLTSLLDEKAYPAAEIAALYHERWELELGFDEIKTHALERAESLRSTSPERTRQEVWGLGVAYNLVRLHMAHVAKELDVPPTRISFRHTLLLLRGHWLTAEATAPGRLPRRIEQLHEEVGLLLLPRRRERQFPREVKIKMSSYLRKR